MIPIDCWWQDIKKLAGEQRTKDLFGTLIAAFGAINRQDLEIINDTLVDDWATDFFDDVLKQVRRFVIGNEDWGYAIVHPRLRQYLRTKIRIDAYDHKLLNFCASWQKHYSLYPLRYYAEHLKCAKQWNDLYTLAQNQTFKDTQHFRLPNEPDLPLRMVQTALQGAAENDDAGAMAELLLIHARRVEQLTLQESPLEALQKGSLERAWRLADLYEIEICVLWYLLLAWVLKDQGIWEEAQKTLNQLQHKELTRLSNWEGNYAAYLIADTFEVSEKTYLGLQKQILDWRSCHSLCRHLTERGCFSLALEVAKLIEIPSERSIALGNVAVEIAKKGDFSWSLDLIHQFQEYKKIWLGKIAVEIALAKDFDKALDVLRQIDDQLEQTLTMAEIARIIYLLGRQEIAISYFQDAIDMAFSITNERIRIRAIWQISKSISKAGNNKLSLSILNEALKLTEYIKSKVLNVKKNPIKIAQNMLNFGRKIKVYLFDSDYKFISQDCQRYLERTAKKRLSSIEQSSIL